MTKTGRINTENSSLGRAAIFLGEDNSANVNGHVYLIRLQKNQVNEFVLHILTSKEYLKLIREVCVGGIDKRQLNKDHIEDFPIIYPSLKLQHSFVEKLLTIQNLKKISENTARNSLNVFNRQLSFYFS
jgi:restriction endonuclease S subunit